MSELPTLAEVMGHVSELERAPTKEAANLARSLIAIKVARLTGDDIQTAFNVLRPAPEKAMTMSRMGGGAVRLVTAPMKDTPLEQVVAELANKLELVPLIRCVCGKPIDAAHRQVAAYGSWCCPDRIGVKREQDDVEIDDVPWGVTQ